MRKEEYEKTMAKTKDDQSTVWTKTDAYMNFENNLDHIMRMLKMIPTADAQKHVVSLKRLSKRIFRNAKRVRKGVHTDLDRTLSDVTVELTEISAKINEFVALHNLLWDWTSVMLVAFVEAYMEEGLEYIATKNPGLLKNADPLSFESIFEVDSLADLKDEIRRQWARKTLRGAGEVGNPSRQTGCSRL